MNDFPKWKYALVILVLLLGTIYALPNLFVSQPAVQISANRGSVVDEALKERVTGILQAKKIEFKNLDLLDDRLLARFSNPELQLQAADNLRSELGDKYVVALNLASTVPAWLRRIGANAMPLGLDLQGGVHFLMEVDQSAALEKQEARYVEDIRAALMKGGVRYQSVNRSPQGMVIVLRSEADQTKAKEIIASEVNRPELLGSPSPLEVKEGTATAENWPLIATVRESTIQSIAKQTISSNLTTLRNRVNQLGVSEPIIQQQGTDRIVVELAGVQDTAEAKKIIGATATLEYRAVDESVTDPSEAEASGRIPPDSRLYRMRELAPDGKSIPIVLKKKVIVTGDELVDASSQSDPTTGQPAVSVTLNAAGAKKMLDFTSQSVGKRMAVVYIERTPETKIIDGKEVRTAKITEEVISAATIQGVFGKQFQTTGLGSSKEASELALLLRAGSLAAPVDIVEERVIGPSLGRDQLNKGVTAAVIGLVLVLLSAAAYYRVFGIVADIALILNLILLLAVLSLFQATLTMPGIAGIVLTLGMAIDANVLICERVREELRQGLSPLASIRAGYEKAWATILDANVTHLLAAFGLMTFGSGPIKGFAITLAIGIVTSMFTSVTITHALTNLLHSGRKLKTLSV